MKIIARLMCVLFLALAAAALPAMADFVAPAGQLTVANANLATQGTGPYASYTITGIGAGTTAASTFTNFSITLTGLHGFVFGGSVGAVALNIASGAGAVTLGTCSFTCSANGSGNMDGFGSFSFRVADGPGFSTGGYSSITVTFTTATAVTVGGLLTPTSSGATVASEMALGTNTACTGFAANGGTQGNGTVDNTACTSGQPPPGVPEPASLILFGTGLSGLGVFARRKLSQ